MPDQEMIEKVAEAMYGNYEWAIANGMKEQMHNTAIKAIKAMRKPTKKMIKSAVAGSIQDCYTSMIDAIIND